MNNVYKFKGDSMPSSNGYISLWRDLRKQDFYKDFIARGIFVDLLLTASHSNKTIDYSGVQIELSEGQLMTKRKHFVNQGVNDSKVERVLKKFESDGIIHRETIKSKGRSIGQKITILGWKKWQKIEHGIEHGIEQPKVTNIKDYREFANNGSNKGSNNINNNEYNNNLLTKVNCDFHSEKSLKPKSFEMPKGGYQQVADWYNEILDELPAVKKLTPNRKTMIRARTSGEFKKDITVWKRYFQYIKSNCHWMLSGKYNINFDYLIKQSNVVKIMEGAKDDRG